MAWLFFKGFGHLDLRVFFRVTGIILIFMAAGMFASGFGHLVSGGLIPGIIEPVWDSSWLLDQRSLAGSLIAGIFGYRSHPSLVEVLAYALYIPAVLLWLRRRDRMPRSGSRSATPVAGMGAAREG